MSKEKQNWEKIFYEKFSNDERALLFQVVSFIHHLLEEQKKEILQEIKNLENPYPEEIFLPIDQETYLKIHEMLKREFSISIDRLAGHIARKLWERWRNVLIRELDEKVE